MNKLDDIKIRQELEKLKHGWVHNDNVIHKEFILKNFIQAFSFMTSVAMLAEKMNHHPDWENAYSKVKIRLTNHELGGVSEKDFELAYEIDKVFETFKS